MRGMRGKKIVGLTVLLGLPLAGVAQADTYDISATGLIAYPEPNDTGYQMNSSSSGTFTVGGNHLGGDNAQIALTDLSDLTGGPNGTLVYQTPNGDSSDAFQMTVDFANYSYDASSGSGTGNVTELILGYTYDGHSESLNYNYGPDSTVEYDTVGPENNPTAVYFSPPTIGNSTSSDNQILVFTADGIGQATGGIETDVQFDVATPLPKGVYGGGVLLLGMIGFSLRRKYGVSLAQVG